MSSCIIVGGIFLAGDQLFRMEELAVSSGPDLINDGRLKVDKDGPGHVLAGPGLREEGVEGIVAAADGLVGRHLAIRLDPMLQAVNQCCYFCHNMRKIILLFQCCYFCHNHNYKRKIIQILDMNLQYSVIRSADCLWHQFYYLPLIDCSKYIMETETAS
jgi:hypothetical protein